MYGGGECEVCVCVWCVLCVCVCVWCVCVCSVRNLSGQVVLEEVLKSDTMTLAIYELQEEL